MVKYIKNECGAEEGVPEKGGFALKWSDLERDINYPLRISFLAQKRLYAGGFLGKPIQSEYLLYF